jgi:5-methylcytosine-specific restriction endonuclease McrA
MLTCNICEKVFHSHQALNGHKSSHVKRGPRQKVYKNKKARIISNCLHCNTTIETLESKQRKYCSNSCQRDHTVSEAIKSGTYTRANAITWYKKNNTYACTECGISEWNKKPITLQIDHIDGNNNNNLIENLRYLCPNCHTQTPTWGSKNASDEGRIKMITNKKV